MSHSFPISRSEKLGLYVHIPLCKSKCRYCNFYSELSAKYDAAALVEAEIAEMHRYKSISGVKTTYIGGGSPSCLAAEYLLRLVGEVARRCPAAEEFTIEVNPGQVDKSLLGNLRSTGVNRLSIGAQSFSQRELDFLGRSHTSDCIRKAVEKGRQSGFQNISLDLIFAVPGSSVESWMHNLDEAMGLEVQHISAYSLTYEPGTPLATDLAAGRIERVDEDSERTMYEMTIDKLAAAGLQQYEISNFARPGFECRHNLNYWANGSYIGIGPGATSYLQGTRSNNVADINRYIELVSKNENVVAESETLNEVERACETAVLNLRRRRGIDLSQFREQTGFDAMKLFAEPIQAYIRDGLIQQADGRLFLARAALAIADTILADFSSV